MRYAMIMAGGSGTRLWPMSRNARPKQLIPFARGKSLLQVALDRLEGLVPPQQRFICAGNQHHDIIRREITGYNADLFLGEPTGRDTLNAVAFAAAVIEKHAAMLGDDEPVIAVFTADHLIEPVDRFRAIVEQGYQLAESRRDALVTFGIRPTHAATGYGYLQLGDTLDAGRVVKNFREKPDAATAKQYLDAGPDQYLWNSGMFVWRAATLLDCVRKYKPDNAAAIATIADSFGTDAYEKTLNDVYPTLEKISVDFAVMEPASTDDDVTVAAVPMDLSWLDIGSWPAFAETCETDDAGNALGAGAALLVDSRHCLVASDDPDHLIATIGCEDLVIIHTADATLICPRDQAERIKDLHGRLDADWL